MTARPRSRAGRYGQRDATMILLSYRHGLKAEMQPRNLWPQLLLTSWVGVEPLSRRNGSVSMASHNEAIGEVARV